MGEVTERVLATGPRAVLLAVLAGHGGRARGLYHRGCRCRLCMRASRAYDQARYARNRSDNSP